MKDRGQQQWQVAAPCTYDQVCVRDRTRKARTRAIAQCIHTGQQQDGKRYGKDSQAGRDRARTERLQGKSKQHGLESRAAVDG